MRLWSRHRLLTAVYAFALLLLLAGRLGVLAGIGLGGLTGHYGLPNLPSLSTQLSFYRYDLSRLVVGTGILSAALAVPWALATLARPRDGGRHALAVVCVLGLAATLVGLLNIAPNGDERYEMYAAVVLALAAAAALYDWSSASRLSRRAALAFLASAGVVVALLASVGWPPLTSDYGWFTFPAATFYQRVLLNHAADLHLSFLAESTIVYLGIVLAAAAVVIVARRPGWTRVAACLTAVGLVALGTTETIYNLRKYVESPAGGGAPTSQRAFVDEAVPANATVAAVGLTLGTTIDYFGIWNAVEFWNVSIKWDAYFQNGGYLPFQPGTTALGLGVAIPSGRITGWPTGPGAPRYLLVPTQGGNWIGFVGQTVAQSPWVPLNVEKLSLPARAAWHVMGTDYNGDLTSGQGATAQVYSGAVAGLGQRCASFSLITPPGFSGRWPYVVQVAKHTYRGWLQASNQTQLSLPIPVLPKGADAMDTVGVTVTGHETLTSPGTAQLVFFNVGACKVDHATIRTSPWPPPAG